MKKPAAPALLAGTKGAGTFSSFFRLVHALVCFEDLSSVAVLVLFVRVSE